MNLSIRPAENDQDIEDARTLFREHIGGIGDDLAFIGLDEELAGLPGDYAFPGGSMFFCRNANGEPVGCVAVRRLNRPGVCELKHLYVRASWRGLGAGRQLVASVVDFATKAGYRQVLLSTLPSLVAANSIYRQAGFHLTEPFYDEPMADALYYCRNLEPNAKQGPT